MRIENSRAEDFIVSIEEPIHLILTDPPYYRIAKSGWDRLWGSESEYVDWLVGVFNLAYDKLVDGGSLVFFSGVGKHGEHPLFRVITELEKKYVYRNFITWKKRRAYGKAKDYLFCREEAIWFTKGDVGCFNIPYLAEKRGYAGFSAKYPAKSEYKRVSNVWDDITELFRTSREAEKPVPLMQRFVEVHSNVGDTVLDCFCGMGATAVACKNVGRNFLGCDIDVDVIGKVKERL
jgi:site-specific DNA-methyltransferase (adenine-specific)